MCNQRFSLEIYDFDQGLVSTKAGEMSMPEPKCRLPTSVEMLTLGRDVVVLYSEGRLPSSESRLPSCEEIATPYV